MNAVTVCNVTGVTRGDKQTKPWRIIRHLCSSAHWFGFSADASTRAKRWVDVRLKFDWTCEHVSVCMYEYHVLNTGCVCSLLHRPFKLYLHLLCNYFPVQLYLFTSWNCQHIPAAIFGQFHPFSCCCVGEFLWKLNFSCEGSIRLSYLHRFLLQMEIVLILHSMDISYFAEYVYIHKW